MFVACPHCGFLVALVASPEDGEQRCPRCDGVLTAELLASGEPDTPTADIADVAAPTDTPTTAPIEPDTAIEPTPETPPPVVVPAVKASTSAPKPRASARKRHAPSFVRTHAPAAARRTHWRWWLAVAALVLLLTLQLLLAQRNELAANARWRPLIGGVCSVLQCHLPPWREPAAFTMLDRSVQPKPGTPGVLHVSASFRNDARWPQPWPTLLLSLSDADGRQAGLRAFAPGDYRNGVKPSDRLAPGQSATVQFDVIEPAPRIIAFTFDFQ